ncbi:aspartate/glutamate racemase family protein [Phenylobacterium aquaticum]|uniref:aspartate/glutamate racemase family protein n=2 Tax=Phenylobacterium aquaticum TaxID=1763816 RepID=UPI0026EC2926|nr:aspartate/glutamate racemase family protein [Phenylobacterium aquaticum]
MRLVGLIGGMSAESTAYYYQTFNRLVRERLGGLHSARLLIWSLDFAPIAALQAAGDWATAGAVLADAARRLEGAGAEAILIGANTMHLVADQVAAAVQVPLIHIGDATAAALEAIGSRRPLLLGTRFTMEMGFYRDRLAARGIEALIPDEADRARLHAIIYDELCQAVISPASKAEVLAITAKAAGADAVIFACTEIGLLLSPDDLSLPVVDTAIVHAQAGVDFSLG